MLPSPRQPHTSHSLPTQRLPNSTMNGHEDAGVTGGDAGDQNAQAGSSAQISTSFFPPPPQVYLRFTKRNLRLLGALNKHVIPANEPKWEELAPAQRMARQNSILTPILQLEKETRRQKLHEQGADNDFEMGVDDGEQDDDEAVDQGLNLPEFDMKLEMEPPNMDWIEEDGGYTVFGQLWPIPDTNPTLEELGIPVLYPLDSVNRKDLLISLLNTLLQTYREITADLLKPAQPYDVWIPAVPPNPADPNAPQQQAGAGAGAGAGSEQQGQPGFWSQSSAPKDRLKHIQNVVVNMQFLINQLRPIQAKETLKLFLSMQLERRRAETKLIKERCEQMNQKIEQLQESIRSHQT
ncbi:hypothetical protein BCV70DRAFT_200912 [Testicularia cyperi]|uniref:Mediator of RNA polymerase II transcription subunit 7 n=1 Tax=Testicularia cyperi TaxID=1882483 RepID=A0A317XPP0_9BASI|nr:hypothetical protein BCV70DRAFT_200912 [Testicularia cyperi]